MNVKQMRADALKAAKDIVDSVQAQGRSFTEAESAKVDAHLAQVEKYDGLLEASAKSKAIADRIAATTLPDGFEDEDGDPGTGLQKDGAAIFSIKGVGQSIASRLMSARGPRGAKAMPTHVAQTVPVVEAEPIHQGGRVDTIFDLLPVRVTETPSWTYRRATRRELAAAVVGTGEVKPTSVIEFEDRIGRLAVIATLAGPLAESTLIDYPAMVRFVEDELLLSIRLAVEDQVFSGTGEAITSSADSTTEVGRHFEGILKTSGVLQQAATGDALGTIATGAMRLEAEGFTVAGIAMHPSDWVALTIKRNASGGFDLGGAVDPAARTIWGHPVRLTRGLPEGTALAIATEAAAIRVGHEGLDVRAITVNDDAARNQVRVRAEGRFALDLYRPGGFVVLDLTA